ncbi:MAG: response regulator [Bdellovibrionales bacterium]
MENKPSILIVDDDAVSLTLLSKLVGQLGCVVLQASDGMEALDILRQHPMTLVIADYDMPNLNGLDLLKQAKSEFPTVPYILVTAYSNLKVIREAWEYGAFDFFQKPVFGDRLNQTIRLAIEYGHLSIARRRFPKFEETQPEPDLLNVGVVRELSIALPREDLLRIVEEYETHARIELEQIFRFNMSRDATQVGTLAHRLSGTSINLGLVKLHHALSQLSDQPETEIRNRAELEQMLEKSIHWLKHHLTQIFQGLAA